MTYLRTAGFGLCAALAACFCIAPSAGAQAPPAPQITADTSQLRTVDQFARRAQRVARDWYPRIVAILGEAPAPAPDHITILMDLGYDGVAATGGHEIHVSPRYVQQHPDDLGMIVHELTHVVQAYPKYDPVWLVEGIADYVRFFYFEPEAKRPHPRPDRANARASYRVTGAFLDWVTHKYDRDLVKKLNHALRTSTYTEGIWKQLTGKDLDALNAEWIASLGSAPAR